MAKSSFWDDLGNTLTRKAKGLSSRAENLYEIQKIRNKLSAQERMTEKLMMDIGKMIYTRYEQGEAVDGETGAICEEISQHMLEADHYRDWKRKERKWDLQKQRGLWLIRKIQKQQKKKQNNHKHIRQAFPSGSLPEYYADHRNKEGE